MRARLLLGVIFKADFRFSFAGLHGSVLGDKAHEQVVERLYFILVGGGFQVFAADAGMVGEENVTAIGGKPKKFHQKLCVFLDTAGCNRHDPDAQTRGLADAFLKAGNHFRLLVRTSVKHQKTYPRHRIFAPFLTKNSLLQRTVYGFRKIAAATCELLLNKFHGLGNIWRKPAAFGDIFIAFVPVKHRTHSVSERGVAAFSASDHVEQFGF